MIVSFFMKPVARQDQSRPLASHCFCPILLMATDSHDYLLLKQNMEIVRGFFVLIFLFYVLLLFNIRVEINEVKTFFSVVFV